MTPDKIVLGPAASIHGAREFTVPDRSGREGSIFVVRRGGRFYAYRNACPHTGVTLNWSPDVFISAEGSHIQCATHGALFRIDDGYCVLGPCAGQSLTPIALVEQHGLLHLRWPVD